MLTVKCPDGYSKDSVRVVSGIINLLTGYLGQRGADGDWKIELYRKTGGGGMERVYFKRKHKTQGRDDALLFQVRPLDRGSSWTVVAYPPKGYNVDKMLNAQPVEKEPEEEEEEQQEEDKDISGLLAINQIHQAKVTEHYPHGFDVEISVKDKKVMGFVGLADLGSYDPKMLNKFPVGKTIRVLVCDTTEPVTCSTKVEAVLSTDNSKDVFTGALNSDGSLPLRAYTKDHRRVFDLLQEIVVEMMQTRKNFLTKDVAVECVTKWLMKKYNAKSIPLRAVPALLRQLCQSLEQVPMPVLRKVDDGYALTDFAWGELGGMEQFFSDAPSEDVLKASTGEEDEDDGEDIGGVVATPPPAPMPLEIEDILEDEDEDVEDHQNNGCDLTKVAEYFGKLCRLNELSSQIASLTNERKEIERWLDENKHLRASVRQVQSVFAEKP